MKALDLVAVFDGVRAEQHGAQGRPMDTAPVYAAGRQGVQQLQQQVAIPQRIDEALPRVQAPAQQQTCHPYPAAAGLFTELTRSVECNVGTKLQRLNQSCSESGHVPYVLDQC